MIFSQLIMFDTIDLKEHLVVDNLPNLPLKIWCLFKMGPSSSRAITYVYASSYDWSNWTSVRICGHTADIRAPLFVRGRLSCEPRNKKTDDFQ